MKKILIANRGEIALRIMRTCQELGIATVAVYSEADQNAPHVTYADESYCLGPAPASESYLNVDKLFQAVRETGADALHPGYGFLSENSILPKMCGENNIIFLGPSTEAMTLMGSKIESKQKMIESGVPVVPGDVSSVATWEKAAEKAEKIGYPVLIKAAFGGGGKGMRAVFAKEELKNAFREATSEAKASFKNEVVFIEKFIQEPRHIEFQVFSDSHGNHIHLGERECSVQRRHQKLLEETPSVALDPELRQKMGKMAVEVAKAANYLGAGTVEFLLDRDKNFYFLEMNTRLQVEHTVTEMVLGMDLVEEQIRVARGEPLSKKQEEIQPRGWAIECRICAEEPTEQFIPSSGKITALREPSGPFVRVDSGLRSQLEITSYYDPMLSKLVVWGENRERAISRLIRALKEYKIVGIQTNIPFHLSLLSNPRFVKGDLSINFIEEERESLFKYPKKHLQTARLLAVALEIERQKSMIPNQTKTSQWNKVRF